MNRFRQTVSLVLMLAMLSIGLTAQAQRTRVNNYQLDQLIRSGRIERGFIGVIEHLRAVGGHIESRLYEDVQSAGSYVIMSEWETKEAFDAFLRSDAFKQMTAWGKAEILRGRPRHKVYLNG